MTPPPFEIWKFIRFGTAIRPCVEIRLYEGLILTEFREFPISFKVQSFLWQLGVKIIFSQETCCTLREPTYNNTSLVDFNRRWKHLVITILNNLSTLSNTRKVGVGRGYFITIRFGIRIQNILQSSFFWNWGSHQKLRWKHLKPRWGW